MAAAARAREPHLRTALGAVAAVGQQRLTTPEQLRRWVADLRPLRRATQIREMLDDVAGGAQSLAEVDIVRACREFRVAPPRARNRKLTTPDRVVVTCSAYELRHEAWQVMEDLIALGVPRI